MTADNLGPISPTRKTGREPFSRESISLDLTVQGFWEWAFSDLMGNTNRGVLAEYIVATAMGAPVEGVRPDWTPWDLTIDGIKIEVKSSAYLQTWSQNRHSTISFGIGATHAWNPVTNEMSEERVRQSDVYVFALLAERNQDHVNPLTLDQWEFYVVPTADLDIYATTQRSITLPRVQTLTTAVSWTDLGASIRAAAPRISPASE